jgi:hypothetical protein
MNEGRLIRGVTSETVDAMSLNRTDKIAEKLKK